MMIVSVTRFRLNSGALRGNALFFWHTLRSVRQAGGAAGFMRGGLYNDANRTYWTITAWEDAAAVRAYQTSGAHLQAMRAMPRFMRWCDEAQTGHFEYTGDALPDLTECHAQLQAHGRFLRLKQPSADHAAGRVPAPQTRTQAMAIRPRPAKRHVRHIPHRTHL